MEKRKIKNLRLWILALFCYLAVAYPCFAQDKIIAVVNNDVITQKEFDDFVAFMRMQMSGELKGRQLDDKIASMKAEFLDRLVEDKIILQEAKKNKISVDENRVKGRVEEIKRQYPSSIEFQEAIRQQGMVQADIEAKVRDQMFMYAIIENKIRSKVIISPAEVTEFYQQNSANFQSQQVWELEYIVLESAGLAEEISQGIKKGQPIENFLDKYSLSLGKLSMREGQFKKDVEQALMKLKTGSVSEPLKIEDKYYVFKLNNIIPPRQLSLAEAQESIYSYLSNRKMQERLAQWLDELKKKSYIKICS
ncbi:MAG: peptidyl-prolyl cis-trans isomerase [Candidatus Omnitrophota bacterium]